MGALIRKLLLPLFLMATAISAHAQWNVYGLSASVQNPNGFVVDADAANADPGHDRDAILASATVTLEIFDSIDQTWQAVFRLLDENGVAQDIALPGGGMATEQIETFPVLLFIDPDTFTVAARLVPAAALSKTKRYRVSCEFQQPQPGNTWLTRGTALQATGVQLRHFTNTTSGDPANNVIATVSSVTLPQPVIIRSQPGQESWTLHVVAELARYDDFDAPPSTGTIPAQFDVVLRDLADPLNPIALAVSSFPSPVDLASHAGAAPMIPARQTISTSLQIQPVDWAVIDPTHHYEVEVTLSHGDTDTDSAITTAGRLLPLSGNLQFGSMVTRISALTGDPRGSFVVGAAPDIFNGTVTVAAGAGTLDGVTSRSFSGALDVELYPATGVLRYRGAAGIAFSTLAVDIVEQFGVRILRQAMTLSQAGLVANTLNVIFPQGFGIATSPTSRRLLPSMDFTNIALDSALMPASGVVEKSGSFWAVHETLPTRIPVASITYDSSTGGFAFTPSGIPKYEREREIATPQGSSRAGNEGYYRLVYQSSAFTMTCGPDGAAKLTGSLDFSAGVFKSHFPADAEISLNGPGTLSLSAGVPASGSFTGGGSATVPQMRGFPKANCGTTDVAAKSINVPGNWQITADGGLNATGTTAAFPSLQWGHQGGANYAHETTAWTSARVLTAGHVFRAAGQPVYADALKPAVVLYSGHGSPADPARIERPGSTGYSEGLADYPGLNFRGVEQAGVTATSKLGGGSLGPYALRPECKYYSRFDGVSGTHQAEDGAVSTMALYGFPTTLNGLALAYLGNDNVYSLTGGSLHVPGYANFHQAFQKLTFHPAGQPREAELSTNDVNTMQYWNADFTPLSFSFKSKNLAGGCPSTNEGAVVFGAQLAIPSLTGQQLHATLAFHQNGNLVSHLETLAAPMGSNEFPELDTRIPLPNELAIAGFGGSNFSLATRGKAYFNNPEAKIPVGGYTDGDGFVSLVGELDVPFFENLRVQIHANPGGVAGSPVYMMGGWPSDAGTTADPSHCWAVANKHFFNDPNFDATNAGIPAGVTLGAYRRTNPDDGLGVKYRPRAQSRWLEVVDLDYPVRWDSQRRFKPADDKTTDLLVLSVTNRLLNLGPEMAEITFGLEVEGVPEISVAKIIGDGAAGIAGALAETVLEGIAPSIQTFDRVLSDRIDPLIGASLGTATEADVIAIDSILRSKSISLWQAQLAGGGTVLNSTATSNLTGHLTAMGDSGGQLNESLLQAVVSMDNSLQSLINILPEDGTPNAALAAVITAMLEQVAPGSPISGDIATIISRAMAEDLPDSATALAEIRQVLLRAKKPIAQARAGLEGGGPNILREELSRALQTAGPGLAGEIEQQLKARLLAARDATGDYWLERSSTESQAATAAIIRTAFAKAAVATTVQTTLRQHFADAQREMRGGMDTLFGELNRVIREAVKAVVANVIGEDFNPGLDSLGRGSEAAAVFGSLSLDGYAAINGDSLQELRLDGKLVMDAPDEMEMQGHLRILALDSNTPRAKCFPAGSAKSEVTLEAAAPLNLLGSQVDIVAGGKFTFGNSGELLGLAGKFGLKGEVDIKGVKIQEILFLFAFGLADNYLGARARASFQGYEFAAALFLGGTCGLEPLELVDPDIVSLLTSDKLGMTMPPPEDPWEVVGIYTYAEGWMPLNNIIGIPDSCLFSLRAGAGAGPFIFIVNGEPLVGSKMFFGITADVLCLASASADIRLLGAVGGTSTPGNNGEKIKGFGLKLLGTGDFSVEVGPCPFCIEFSKTVKFHSLLSTTGTSFGFGH